MKNWPTAPKRNAITEYETSASWTGHVGGTSKKSTTSAARTKLVTTITVRRLTRSATAPAIGPKMTAGREKARITKLTAVLAWATWWKSTVCPTRNRSEKSTMLFAVCETA